MVRDLSNRFQTFHKFTPRTLGGEGWGEFGWECWGEVGTTGIVNNLIG